MITVAESGLTVTDATGTGVMARAAAPLWPPLVAVMVAAPGAMPVTRPLPATVATPGLLEVQVTTRPLSGLPFASWGVAVSCGVCPVITLAETGLTVTDATGTGATVSAAVPLWPSLVAVMVAGPGAMPVTSPLTETVARLELLDVQVTTRPLNGLPSTSFGVAVSCVVCPAMTLAETGLTATD